MSKIRIVMDDRESGSRVGQLLQARSDVQVIVKRLSTGDYLVNDQIVFERKTLQDLLASIKDGRLFAQARHLAATSLPSALILQGTAREIADSRMHRESVQGALISLSLLFGIPVLRARDAEECVRIMLYAAGQSRISHCKHVRRYGRKLSAKREQQMAVLQAMPGVGPYKAEHILNRYSTLSSLCTATEADLADTKGIGRKTAHSIFNIIHERKGIYRPA